MSAGAGRLTHALKTLRIKWEAAQETWRDGVARDFEKVQLQPLEQQAAATARAMHELDEVLAKMRRECGREAETY